MTAVLCQECNKECWKVKGHAIYGRNRRTDNLWFWLCECGAYVGCYPGTDKTLGTAAGPILRRKRGAAHVFFDLLWEQKAERQKTSKPEARKAGYYWLSEQMGSKKIVHISQMNIEQCETVIRICRPYYDRLREQIEERLKR